jgi:hypothetical protein
VGIKKNNPGCGCCDGGDPPTPTCPYCTGGPSGASITLTLTGFADGNCSNCDEVLNATHVLPNVGQFGTSCYWSKSTTEDCVTGISTVGLTITVNMSNLGAWQASVTYGTLSLTFSNSPLGPFDTNCTATRTLTRNAGSGSDCVWTGATTCQVN